MFIEFDMSNSKGRVYIDPDAVIALHEDLYKNVTTIHCADKEFPVYGKIAAVAKKLGLELSEGA